MEIFKHSTVSKRLGEPWPNKFVRWIDPPADLPDRLQEVIDAAQDERPIQKFFEKNPVALAQILRGGHGRWVFPKAKLGSEFVVDFMLCERDSGGYHWWLVELENPTHKALRKDGQQTEKLTRALRQIRDWRIWLKDNCQYAQNQLGFTDLDGEFQGIVVIGRRSHLDQRHQKQYRALSGEKLEVMSCDRLLGRITGAVESHRKALLSINRDE